jgi:hypothetical protein
MPAIRLSGVAIPAHGHLCRAIDQIVRKVPVPDEAGTGNKWQWQDFSPHGQNETIEENYMNKFAIALLAGAGALLAGSANASDLSAPEYTSSDLVQPVRLICNEDGRCYRTRGGSRVIVEDSYTYAPRERYIERRGYQDWDDGPRSGVGIRAPGVDIGIGVGGGHRW